MEETKTGNVNDILKLMNRANDSFAYEIFIPSLDKNIMFRQITTAQQKRLLKSIIDSPAYNTEFIFCFKQIIEENCVEKLDIGELTIIDKLIIALKMRSISISNDLDIKFKVPKIIEKDGNKETIEEEIIRRINVSDLTDEAIKHSKVDPMSLKDDKGIFEVFCTLPTINDEYKLEDQLRRNNTQIDIKNEADLRETIGNVFINELVKYIKIVNIKEGEKIIEINLKDISVVDRIKIIGQLPSLLIKQVIEYIGNINKQIEQVLLFKHIAENGKVFEQRLKIDASFFTFS